MAAAKGAYTTDNVPVRLLLTEIIDSIERHNEVSRNWKTEFCKTTHKETVRIRQRSMVFERGGSDTTVADLQHLDYRELDLTAPDWYLLRPGVTKKAFDRGISSDEIREHHREALDADYRLVAQIVLRAMLLDGGWWDAAMSMAPPLFKMNSFATSHDHYLAYNVAGVSTLAHYTRLQRHIQEHGYGMTASGQNSVVAIINGTMAESIVNTAEWIDNTNDRIPGPVMNALQALGLTPSFTAGGIPVIADDWIPANYILAFDSLQKPCRWRLTDNSIADDLQVIVSDDDAQYVGVREYIRWQSCRVVLRGAGACAYLGSASWTDPTGWEI